jgi:hypothetical protein
MALAIGFGILFCLAGCSSDHLDEPPNVTVHGAIAG